jgi:hypothetical protein
MTTTQYDLHRFQLSDMIELGASIRQAKNSSRSMEDAASAIVQQLYKCLTDAATSEKSCVLVRCFKTHRFADLEPQLQSFARATAKDSPSLTGDTRCLTLLATAGAQPEWNQRSTSAGHQAIPLVSEEVVLQAPMVAQLIQQIGLDISQVVRPNADLMIERDPSTYNVFHVPEALGSPYVPAQDFVRANNVKSVLGFGGLFPNGDLFAIIIFSRVYIPRQTAEMFRTLALGVKMVLLPFVRGQVFSH